MNFFYFLSSIIIFLLVLLNKIAYSESEFFKKILYKFYNQVRVSKEIVNRHDFEYLQNPGREFCSFPNKIFLIIYVHSSPNNLKRRIAIRETWAKNSFFLDIKTIFVMGKNDNQSNDNIKLEQGIYNDIVQENFVDSYRNLTYKGIAALKWISNYCTNTKFVLKADDDMIIDMFAVLKHLKSLSDHNAYKPRSVMCYTWDKARVFRDKNEKWYLTKEEYNKDWFGQYCSGSAFILTSDIVSEMFTASLHIRFFWIDDYYVSGLLIRAIGASYVSSNTMYTIDAELIESRYMQKNGQAPLFSHSPNSINLLYQIWKMIIYKHLTNYHDNSLAQPETSLSFRKFFEYTENFKWTLNYVFNYIPLNQIISQNIV